MNRTPSSEEWIYEQKETLRLTARASLKGTDLYSEERKQNKRPGSANPVV